MPDVPRNPWAISSLDGYSGLLTRMADGMRQVGAFGEPQQWQFDWERPYTRDEWLDLLPTSGESGNLRAATMAELVASTGAAIDALGGGFTMRYAAVVVTARRTG